MVFNHVMDNVVNHLRRLGRVDSWLYCSPLRLGNRVRVDHRGKLLKNSPQIERKLLRLLLLVLCVSHLGQYIGCLQK